MKGNERWNDEKMRGNVQNIITCCPGRVFGCDIRNVMLELLVISDLINSCLHKIIMRVLQQCRPV